MVVNLINDAGLMKQAPVGFSWTMLLFGPFVPLFRGDLKWTILHLLMLSLAQLFSGPFVPSELFFSPFVFLFAFVQLFIGLFIICHVAVTTLDLLTQFLPYLFFGIGWIVLPFIYNKRYIINLLERGYKPADEESRVALVNKGIIADMNLKE